MASQTENENDFVDVATYSSEMTKDKVVFKLSKSIKAKRIKFVFEEAYQDWASIGDIRVYKQDTTADQMKNLFTNGLMNEVSEAFN